MRWKRPYTVGAIMAVVALALLLNLTGRPLAAQQAQYEVIRRDQTLPLLDPGAAEWNDVPALEVVLVQQGGVPPALREVSVPSMTVQAVHDGATIVFRVEWADDTRDVQVRPDAFADTAAIQFPVGDALPSICMGAPGQLSNIWHWKADLQEDLDQGFQDVTVLYPGLFKDYYPFVTGEPPYDFPEDFTSEEARAYSPSWAAGNPMVRPDRTTPVDNLVALGFGTLTGNPAVEIQGAGRWQDGRWRVVFSRAMAADQAETVSFADRDQIPVAFAVWNGSNEEVGARKQHSTYLTFSLAAEQGSHNGSWLYTGIAGGFMAMMLGGARMSGLTQRRPGAAQKGE
jgi:hypothetical protein